MTLSDGFMFLSISSPSFHLICAFDSAEVFFSSGISQTVNGT